MTSKNDLLSIVVPCFNEQEVLPEFHRRISAVLANIDMAAEVILVNDGSSDQTIEIMRRLAAEDPRFGFVDLSRNFGKEIALSAGLDHARGTIIVPIDADLQDPPELIPELIARWREGFDVVCATRRTRQGETWIKKATARLFYRLMQQVGDRVKIPENTGDFRLMSRRALNALCQMREQHRFLKGLFTVVGFRQTSVLYDRDPRHAGETKWNYWRLLNLSIEGITSFTIAPLKLATYLGLFVAFAAFLYAAWIVYKTLRYGDPVAGYPSLLTVVLFLGGVQMLALGVIGEYLGRIFNETKNRPLYFIQDHVPAVSSADRKAVIDEVTTERLQRISV
jgi:polyisoprenyl-phosphate glycosyltransferase